MAVVHSRLTQKSRRFNTGVAILKVLMCFGVIGCHFGRSLGGIEVPLFALMAFAMSAIPENRDVLLARLRRLALPFWFWGLAGLIVWPLTTKSDFSFLGLLVRLVGQLALGSSLNSPLYFIFIVVLLTCLFYLINKFRLRNVVYGVIVVVAFSLQYSGLNSLLCRIFPMGADNVIGRISEFAPYAVFGAVLNLYRNEVFKSPFVWVSVGIALIVVSTTMGNLLAIPSGFGYQGFTLFFFLHWVVCSFIWRRCNF